LLNSLDSKLVPKNILYPRTDVRPKISFIHWLPYTSKNILYPLTYFFLLRLVYQVSTVSGSREGVEFILQLLTSYPGVNVLVHILSIYSYRGAVRLLVQLTIFCQATRSRAVSLLVKLSSLVFFHNKQSSCQVVNVVPTVYLFHWLVACHPSCLHVNILGRYTV
jgi:hypothetical protein